MSGEEELRKGEALEELRIAAGGERGTVRKFSASEASAEEILEARANLSLLDPVALILVRGASRLPESVAQVLGPALAEGAAGPPVVFADLSVDKRKKLFADIAKAGGEVEFRPLRASEARTWVEGAARSLGHRLSGGVSELLVEHVGSDLASLRSTLETLSLAVGEGGAIDEKTVLAMVPDAQAGAMYELQDAIAERNGERATALYRRAIEHGETPYLLVGVLFAEVRRLLIARALPPGADAVRLLRTPPFKVEAVVRNAKRFRTFELERAIGELADIDVALKTGVSDGEAALELWLVAFCQASLREGAGRRPREGRSPAA